MYRRQIEWILKDLDQKMVFIMGPRQVGKTWLAREVAKYIQPFVYLNYDHFEDRHIMETQGWLSSTRLLILDELHKMPQWKTYLKGLFDTRFPDLKILVTGSARLDAYQHAGDSLAGRFFRHRLMPFSPAELQGDLDSAHFVQRGGFPEPFLSKTEVEVQRWRKQYIEGLLRVDVLDFGGVQHLRTLETIVALLRRRVGSPVSFAAIARDVQVSPTTVMKYIQILEILYIIFSVRPYSRNIARSILKEPKIYFYDNGLVIGDEGSRFENMVANCLLKHGYGREDYLGEDRALQYLRTKDGKEVDFCLVLNGEIECIIEAKYRDRKPDKNLQFFCQKYGLNGIQVVQELRQEWKVERIEVRQADQFLRKLFL